MLDRDKAQEALLTAQNTKLPQQLAVVQEHVTTNRMSPPVYFSKFSSDITSEFQEFYRRLLESAREIVQSRQRGIKGSVEKAPDPFEQTFKILESQLDKKLANA